jgi:hypothetical protein
MLKLTSFSINALVAPTHALLAHAVAITCGLRIERYKAVHGSIIVDACVARAILFQSRVQATISTSEFLVEASAIAPSSTLAAISAWIRVAKHGVSITRPYCALVSNSFTPSWLEQSRGPRATFADIKHVSFHI